MKSTTHAVKRNDGRIEKTWSKHRPPSLNLREMLKTAGDGNAGARAPTLQARQRKSRRQVGRTAATLEHAIEEIEIAYSPVGGYSGVGDSPEQYRKNLSDGCEGDGVTTVLSSSGDSQASIINGHQGRPVPTPNGLPFAVEEWIEEPYPLSSRLGTALNVQDHRGYPLHGVLDCIDGILKLDTRMGTEGEGESVLTTVAPTHVREHLVFGTGTTFGFIPKSTTPICK